MPSDVAQISHCLDLATEQATRSCPERSITSLAPLLHYYHNLSLSPPSLQLIDPSTFPSPYDDLLSPPHNMTPTLEKYFASSLHLDVLQQIYNGETQCIHRWIRLILPSQQAVEFGSIIIYLQHIPRHLHPSIVEGRIPFGRILIDNNIQQQKQPKDFFTIIADEHIKRIFQHESESSSHPLLIPHISIGSILYGRCNIIRNDVGELIAEVVELLPHIKYRTIAAGVAESQLG